MHINMCYDILYDDNGISVLITNSCCVCFLYSDNSFFGVYISVVVTETNSTGVSVSGPVGPDYSSGCGVQPVGSS